MDPIKIQGVADWPIPRNVTDVRSFLGFTNFYRRFIRNFSDVAKPLNALLQKDANGNGRMSSSKRLNTLNPSYARNDLVFPTEDRAFLVEADSSGYATGAVLSKCVKTTNGIPSHTSAKVYPC